METNHKSHKSYQNIETKNQQSPLKSEGEEQMISNPETNAD